VSDILRRGDAILSGVDPDAPAMHFIRGCRWAEAMAVATGDPAWAFAAGTLWGMAVGSLTDRREPTWHEIHAWLAEVVRG